MSVESGEANVPSPAGHARKVLLVEDNPGDAELIMDLIESPNGEPDEVTHAVTLAEALRRLSEAAADVVLLDLRLPDASGVECVNAIIAHAGDAPIVVLTGVDDDALARTCLEAGAQDYLSKQEVRRQTLRRAIGYAVARAHERAERRRSEVLRARAAELELENRRIQEVSKVKSMFLATMSHELRTPLNAIIGFSQLLQSGEIEPTAPEFHEFLGHILSSSEHLMRLVNDVLDLAKVEAGALQFRPAPTDLADVIAEVVATVRGTANRNVTVDVEHDASIGTVVLDPVRLKQILFNYLSNAMKFAADPGRVRIRTSAPDSESFTLEVEDDGPGISPQNLTRLFVEFQQLDDGPSRRAQGTGLGLALTKRLVEAQGGSVGARSTVGAGSTFFATLPRRMPAADEHAR
ncbi:MAG TPA: hybrid sensor histidine kinase/response regulator [Polyangiaceae bacterium]|jgi:signal transduction histidine kinase|nr:hybrid sensor histidine kinase/response regulator [Polyangiaceae bacterium]